MSASDIEDINTKIELDTVNKQLIVGDSIIKFEQDVVLDEKWKLKAQETLGETPEVMERTKKELIELIQAEEGLNFPIDNDFQIFRFLRPSQYNVEKAFKSIRRHFLFRSKNPHLSKDLLPTLIREPFLQNIILGLPVRDQEGRRILYMKLGKNWRPSECPAIEILRAMMLMGESGDNEPYTQIAGGVIIIDMNGFSFDKIFALSPSFAKSTVDYLQKVLPMDIKALHFINQPRMFSAFFSLFKPFIHERFRNRVLFHGNTKKDGLKSLLNHIDAANLPYWLGGELNYPKNYSPQLRELLILFMDMYEDNVSWGYNTNDEN